MWNNFIYFDVHTKVGLSIKRLQLLSSVGELSSSELADLDAIFCMFVISQLKKSNNVMLLKVIANISLSLSPSSFSRPLSPLIPSRNNDIFSSIFQWDYRLKWLHSTHVILTLYLLWRINVEVVCDWVNFDDGLEQLLSSPVQLLC